MLSNVNNVFLKTPVNVMRYLVQNRGVCEACMQQMTYYDSTTISDTQPRTNMTTMGKGDTPDFMVVNILLHIGQRACKYSVGKDVVYIC